MHEIVLDLETEKAFSEVGGRHNLNLLGISVVGIYSYANNTFACYEKEEFKQLSNILHGSRLLVGFNIKYFDIPVLKTYLALDLPKIHVLDLMDDVAGHLGFRVSLDNLASATLGSSKSGNGLKAIDWWRAGEKEKVKEYCLHDVKLTRDLYEFGRENGFVRADTRNGGRVEVRVGWKDLVASFRQRIEQDNVQPSLI